MVTDQQHLLCMTCACLKCTHPEKAVLDMRKGKSTKEQDLLSADPSYKRVEQTLFAIGFLLSKRSPAHIMHQDGETGSIES